MPPIMTDNPAILPDHYSNGHVPVFTPTIDQFADFNKFVKAINSYGMESGIVKVIPPKEWVDALPQITAEKILSVKIRNPIVQNINGAKGVYVAENIEKKRTFSLPEWKKLSQMSNHQPPYPRGAKRRQSIVKNEAAAQKVDQTEFDYNINTDDFTPERCEFLENNYWKTLSYAQPMYGADCLGSIFDDSIDCWNVARLPNLLDYLDALIPGVNDAYLYAGLWKASFAWHLEDQDLYSINYLHFGAPKQWYSIPQTQAQEFYSLMVESFPENHKQCSEFLRHKTFMASPSFLESKGIQVNKVTHHQHEFIITFPFGYHAGFNYDYNLAESVNFALEEWLDMGLKSKKCECIADSVGIDVVKLINDIKKSGDNEEVNNYQLPEDKMAAKFNERHSLSPLSKEPLIQKQDDEYVGVKKTEVFKPLKIRLRFYGDGILQKKTKRKYTTTITTTTNNNNNDVDDDDDDDNNNGTIESAKKPKINDGFLAV